MKDQIKKIIDKFWNYSDRSLIEELHFHKEKPFENEIPKFEQEELNKSYHYDNTFYDHSEFVRLFSGDICIEPDYANCIVGKNEIINSSVFYKALVPSFPRFLKARLNKKESYDCLIVFDGQVGSNYFHFFIDVLNKIWMLDMIPNYTDFPILIGAKTYNTKYFQYILQKNEQLKKLNWIVQQPGEYIFSKSVYLILCSRFKTDFLLKSKSIFEEGIKPIKASKRVFMNRPKSSGRCIENMTEIIPILNKYDFQVVENEGLSVQEQIEFYNSVKTLISIHGAGNTNILFTNKSLSFLEINPENRISGHFYWMALALGIRFYDCLLGGPLPFTNVYPEGAFYVDPEKFENKVLQLISMEDE